MRSTSPTSRFGEAARARPAARPLALPRVSGLALYLGALVLLGLALRLWFIAVNDIDPRYSAADDGDYYQRALRFAATGEYIDNSWLIRPPGHVFMFAAMLRLAMLFGDPTLGIGMIRGLQVVLSLLLIPVAYDLGRRLFSRGAGLILAAIMAVWFPMVELPALILSEPLFFFMLVLHLWLIVRWRDSRREPGSRPALWLVGAGLTLAAAALARSPAFYGSAFTLVFLLIETRRPAEASYDLRPRALLADLRSGWARRFLVAALAFSIPFAGLIAPWTIRNYVTYQRLIVIDTLGPVNLWMAMSDAVNEGRGEGEAKAILAGIAQEERQEFVSEDISRILREEPWRLVRNFWPHFIHIWKAQWVEDYFVKVSFFTRPLRETLPLGAVSDVIWLVFSAASVFALAARPREGGLRLLAFGWIAYSCLTVMLIHVEPRYLLPIWFLMALYGSAALAAFAGWLALRRRDRPAAQAQAVAYLRSPWGLGGVALFVALLALIFTYRDYPRIIGAGIQREIHRNAGDRAYAAGDYPGAIAAYERMLAVAPNFVDGRTDLARVYVNLGRYDEGWAALGTRQTHRSDMLRGALARGQDNLDTAVVYFEDAEVRAGEDIQKLAMEWLRPAPVQSLRLGDGLDFGYLDGFSFGEDAPPDPDGQARSYRWLQGWGIISLPLTEPLQAGDVLRLRMAGGPVGDTPVRLTIGGVETEVTVAAGKWRTYRIAVPDSLAGQSRITVELRAPTFIPVQVNPASGDARLLSVMISAVAVD
jgi:4-amino-4-deoxy-L-arabinose transferase-like glycosyltransferase